MRQVNYKSDFSLILRLLSRNPETGETEDIGFPDYDWVAIFRTWWNAETYTASCIGGECVNCLNDGGRIRVVFNDHGLSPGVLRVEFRAELPNDTYPDLHERVVTPAPLDIELIRAAAPCPSAFEAELMLPCILAAPPVHGRVEFVSDKAVYRMAVSVEPVEREELPQAGYGYGGYGYCSGGEDGIGTWGD